MQKNGAVQHDVLLRHASDSGTGYPRTHLIGQLEEGAMFSYVSTARTACPACTTRICLTALAWLLLPVPVPVPVVWYGCMLVACCGRTGSKGGC